jgi:hypothetical protein
MTKSKLSEEESLKVLYYSLTTLVLVAPMFILRVWSVQYFWNQIVCHLTHLDIITTPYAFALTLALNTFARVPTPQQSEGLSKVEIARNGTIRVVVAIIFQMIFLGIIWFVTN